MRCLVACTQHSETAREQTVECKNGKFCKVISFPEIPYYDLKFAFELFLRIYFLP